MTPFAASLTILGIGLVIALGIVALGAIRVAKNGEELKSRVEGYTSLPVLAYAASAREKVARATSRIEAAPRLAYRAEAALAEIARSRATIGAFVRSPSALWRFGEWIVTGK